MAPRPAASVTIRLFQAEIAWSTTPRNFDVVSGAASFSGSAAWMGTTTLGAIPATGPTARTTAFRAWVGQPRAGQGRLSAVQARVTAINLTGVNANLAVTELQQFLTIALSSGSLTLQSSTGTATVNVSGGTDSIGSQLTLASTVDMVVSEQPGSLDDLRADRRYWCVFEGRPRHAGAHGQHQQLQAVLR